MPEATLETKVEEDKKEKAEENANVEEKPYLRNYELDKFRTSRFIRFFIIEEGHEAVSRRMGKYSGFPYGKRLKPGLHFILGLGGLWSDFAPIDMRLRTEQLKPMKNVITGGKLELPRVDATLNYQVINPVKALLSATSYVFTTHEIAEARLRSELGSLTLEELTERKANQYNFMKDETGKEYDFPELNYVGVKMTGLYITQINIPDELRKALAQQEIAIAEAEGEVALAEKRVRVAELHAEAGKHYSTPESKMLLDREIADEAVKNNKLSVIVGAGGIMKGIGELIDKVKE